MVNYVPKKYVLLILILLNVTAILASPDCPIVTARFSGLPDGTTSNNSANGWYLDASQVTGGYFAVKSNRLHAQELGGQGIWYSNVFSTAGYTGWQVAIKITAEGDMDSTEYVRLYYRIDGGPEVLYDQRTGNFGTIDFISPALNGNSVQLIVKIYNYNNGGSQTSKYYIEEYRVFKEKGPCAEVPAITVTATASNNGALTCNNPSLTLSASSSASGTSYTWTGSNGFTSTSQNPVVTVPGTYTVTGTSASGTGTASVTVTDNRTAPDFTATGGALGCAASTTISVSSAVTNATFSWSGPGGFSSTQQQPVVTTAGTYTVVVSNPANGCTASGSVVVTAGAAPVAFWVEDFSLPNGTTSDNGATGWTLQNIGSGTFSVQNNEMMVSFSSANEGVWLSDVIDISGKTDVVVSALLRSGTAGSSDYLEDDDYIRVYYKLNNGPEILIYGDEAGLNGVNNGTSSLTVNSGPLSGSTIQIVIRARNSHSTERYYFDNVTLTGTESAAVNAIATASGEITCVNTSVQLSGSSSLENASYAWSGPGGFTSTEQNPVVTTPGIYTLTVTSANGCSGSDTAQVAANNAVPENVSIAFTAGSGTITCAVPAVALQANADAPGVDFTWNGPGGYTAAGAAVSVTVPGEYVLTATNTGNGCFDTAMVSVAQDVSLPAGVTASFSNELNCFFESTTLTGTSTTSGVSYSWTGPGGFSASTAIVPTNVPGTYTLTVTKLSNGCTATAITTVTENKTPPADVTATNDGPLTCDIFTVAITGSSSTPGVDYFWTGPNDLIGFSEQEFVSEPGEYILTVTNLDNGCTAIATTEVAFICDDRRIAARTSAATEFTGAAVTEINAENAAKNYEFRAWPNPFTSQASIEFKLPEAARVTVNLYDATGKREKALFQGTAQPNQLYRFALEGQGLHAGVHYCILSVNGVPHTHKIVLLK